MIAFDNATKGTDTSNPIDLSFTVASGSNRLLIVHVSNHGNVGPPTVDSVSYGAQSMTKIRDVVNGQQRTTMWYLVAPTVGTATISAQVSGGSDWVIGATCLTGVDQSSPIGATASGTGNSASPSTNITTLTANSWIVDSVAWSGVSGGAPSPGSAQIERWDHGASPGEAASSTKLTISAGATSMSWTDGAPSEYAHAIIEVKPANGLAIDSTSSSSGSGSTSLTYAHTVGSGNKRMLVVSVLTDRSISSVSYNGVAMTQGVLEGTNLKNAVYYLANPASGTNNVVITIASSGAISSAAISLTGADTSVGNNATGYNGSVTNLTTNITLAASQSLTIESQGKGSATSITQNSNQHEVADLDLFGDRHGTAFKAHPSSGSKSLQFTGQGGAAATTHAILEIKESTSTDYPLTAAQGSFTLTGQTALFHIAMRIVAAQGSYSLTGQNALFAFGRGIVAGLGSFVLSGQNALLNSTRKIVSAVGLFTLTGQAATFQANRVLTALVGLYTLTGQAARGLLNGSSTWLTNIVKNAVSLTNISKNSASLTNVDKNSAGLTNIEKS